MFYGEGIQGKANFKSKALLHLWKETEEKLELEIEVEEHFCNELDYFTNDDHIDFYYSDKDILENILENENIVLEINKDYSFEILIDYDIIYTKYWTDCGYEHDAYVEYNYYKIVEREFVAEVDELQFD